MKWIIIAFCISTAALWILSKSQSHAAPSETVKPKNPPDAGRALRMMMLTNNPATLGVKPSKDFPRIYGVLMDWPVGKEVVTVFSASDGAASIYTTSTFGVIGGEGHASVRTAATAFVRAADRRFDRSTKTSDFPYPAEGRVRFYFLTFDGVRVIETELAALTSGKDECAELYKLGQEVITQLRLITAKQKGR